MECRLSCHSSWNVESDCNLESSVKIFEDLVARNPLELLDEDSCVSLVPPIDSQTASECDLFINLCNCSLPQSKLLSSNSAGNTSNEDSTSLKFFNSKLSSNNSEHSSNLDYKPKNCCKFSNSFVDAVILLSEARIAEVFTTRFQEYFKTFHGEEIMHLDDTKIFKITVQLKKPEKYILLKLKSLFSSKSLWIFGLFLNTSQCKKASIPNVDPGLLGLLNRFPSKTSGNTTPSPQNFMSKMLELSLENNNFSKPDQLDRFKKEMSMLKNAERSFMNMSSITKEKAALDDRIPDTHPEVTNEKLLNSFEDIIDKKLELMESRIIKKLESKVEQSYDAINTKLNKIESLLQEAIERSHP